MFMNKLLNRRIDKFQTFKRFVARVVFVEQGGDVGFDGVHTDDQTSCAVAVGIAGLAFANGYDFGCKTVVVNCSQTIDPRGYLLGFKFCFVRFVTFQIFHLFIEQVETIDITCHTLL